MTGFIQSIITIVLFILMLGVLVVIHELGHFFAARLARVRVLEFGVGFPPRAKVLRSKGETLYTLNWLPIGGFVKLEGEDGTDADDPRSFSSQRYLTKMLDPRRRRRDERRPRLRDLHRHRPVRRPGGRDQGRRRPGRLAGRRGRHRRRATRSSSIDGRTLRRLRARAPGRGPADARRRDGRPSASRRRTGPSTQVQVTLRPPSEIDATHGALGITSSQATVLPEPLHYSVGEAIQIGAQRTVDALGLIVGGLGSLVASVANDPTAPPPVSGPVGIAASIGDVFWQLGPLFTLYVAGVLSANLAVVNILPFPPLDGGRMLMITLKRLFGARISVRAEQLTYMVGFVFLFAFLFWVTSFDIAEAGRGFLTVR